MKIAALLLTAVVVLDSVDISLQGNTPASKCFSPPTRPPFPSPYRPSSPPSERKKHSDVPESSQRPTTSFAYLPHGSRIIKGVRFPKHFYYKMDRENNFGEILSPCDAVVNYERKIVGIFLNDRNHELYGLYYGQGGDRVKINPACLKLTQEHIDYLDTAGYHYYPEFTCFERPQGITIESPKAYKRLGHGLTCAHTPEEREWFFNLPDEAHIVRGVQFPPGFFFKFDKDGPFHPLALHNCDVVVDQSKMIVGVFLGPREYKLFGIYRGAVGKRVKVAGTSMEDKYLELNDDEIDNLYMAFAPYHKPPEKFRNSLKECN